MNHPSRLGRVIKLERVGRVTDHRVPAANLDRRDRARTDVAANGMIPHVEIYLLTCSRSGALQLCEGYSRANILEIGRLIH